MPDRTARHVGDLAQIYDMISAAGLPVTVSWRQGYDRTQAQNRLMWAAAKDVGAIVGETAEETQSRWKLDFGCQIMREASGDFDKAYRMAIEPLDRESRLQVMAWGWPVTRKMKRAEFNRFVELVQRDCAEMGIVLEVPE